jgi:hypothetical protein
MLAALAKWGIAPKFVRSDWRTHNRDAVQGFGPLYGLICHNFGSDVSDDNSLTYLYNGDTSRGMPGPLSQFAITDDGQVWVVGWGTANHTGSIGAPLLALVQKDQAPLDRDVVPTTTFSNKTGVLAVNDNFLGVEMTYGKAPTDAQRASLVRLGAALMDALGTGYTGGSVVGHRECDSQRSDPVGVPMWQLRKQINALLKAGPTGAAPAPAPVAPEGFLMALSDQQQQDIYNRIMGGIPDGKASGRTVNGGATRVLDTADGNSLRLLLNSIATKVGADVDEAALAQQILAGLAPQVADAVRSAASAQPGIDPATVDALSTAVVEKLGAKLSA